MPARSGKKSKMASRVSEILQGSCPAAQFSKEDRRGEDNGFTVALDRNLLIHEKSPGRDLPTRDGAECEAVFTPDKEAAEFRSKLKDSESRSPHIPVAGGAGHASGSIQEDGGGLGGGAAPTTHAARPDETTGGSAGDAGAQSSSAVDENTSGAVESALDSKAGPKSPAADVAPPGSQNSANGSKESAPRGQGSATARSGPPVASDSWPGSADDALLWDESTGKETVIAPREKGMRTGTGPGSSGSGAAGAGGVSSGEMAGDADGVKIEENLALSSAAVAEECGETGADGEGQGASGDSASSRMWLGRGGEAVHEKAENAHFVHGLQYLSPAHGASGGKVDAVSAGDQAGSLLQRLERMQEFIDNAGRHVLLLVKGDVKQMTVTLVPGDLGRVILNCHETGSGVSVLVRAENPAAYSLLQRQEAAVRAVLEQGGYAMARFEVGAWKEGNREKQGWGQRSADETNEQYDGQERRQLVSARGGATVAATVNRDGSFWAIA